MADLAARTGPGHGDDEGDDGHSAQLLDAGSVRPAAWTVWVVAALAAAPALVAAISVVGADWHPVGDHALEVLRIRDVGGADTPLVGAWSRWGYAHPGPWLFWVLAPFEWMLGATGILVGTGLLNAVVASAAVLVAGRAGMATAAVVGAATIALSGSLGMSILVDPWNPWIAVLPMWLFLVATWRASCGDLHMWPVAILAASFTVQAHIGYMPVIAAIGLVGVGIAVLARRSRPGTPPRSSLWLWMCVAVVAVMWLPVLLEQFSGPTGNVTAIVDYLRSPPDDGWGMDRALEVAGRQMGWRVPWVTGADVDGEGFAGDDNALWAVAALVALVAMGVLAGRRGWRSTAAGAALAVTGIAAATFTTARLTGFEVAYVVLWWRPVAAFAATMLLVGILEMADLRFGDTSRSDEALSPRAERATAMAGTTVCAVAAAVVVVAGLPVSVPDAALSDMVRSVAPSVADQLDDDATYVVGGGDPRRISAAPDGVLVELRDRGFDVRARPGELAVLQFGEDRITDPDDADGLLVVMSREALDAGIAPPDGAEVLTEHRSLTPAERRTRSELEQSIRADVAGTDYGAGLTEVLVMNAKGRSDAVDAGADPDEVDEFAELQEADAGYVVFLAPNGT